MSTQPSTQERCLLRRESPVDLTDLQTLCDDGPYLTTFMDEVIGLFIKHAPLNYDVTRLALEHGDGPSLTRASHKLKSQAAYFGARSLVRVCEDLEVFGGRGELVRCEPLVDDLEDELDRVIAALLPLHRSFALAELGEPRAVMPGSRAEPRSVASGSRAEPRSVASGSRAEPRASATNEPARRGR